MTAGGTAVATRTWNGSTGVWTNPTDWSGQKVPHAGDLAMALKAATALSRRDEDVADLKSDMRLLKWMVGATIGLALLLLSAMIAGTITISIRLGELSGQMTQLAQRIH
jgi:hypothetical protein